MLLADNSNGERLVVRLIGRFEMAGNSHQYYIKDFAKALRSAKGREVQIDLSEVSYVDSISLGLLLLWRDQAEKSGKSVVLSSPSRKFMEVLRLVKFHKLFSIRKSFY